MDIYSLTISDCTFMTVSQRSLLVILPALGCSYPVCLQFVVCRWWTQLIGLENDDTCFERTPVDATQLDCVVPLSDC